MFRAQEKSKLGYLVIVNAVRGVDWGGGREGGGGQGGEQPAVTRYYPLLFTSTMRCHQSSVIGS